MTTICYYHDDLDGLMSAAVILCKYPDCKTVPVNYNSQKWLPESVSDSDIFVVDFTFDDMDKLDEAAQNLIWIDHHKSAMEKFPQLWNSEKVLGKREIGSSGCKLTFEYLYSEKEVPLAIKLANDHDLWLHEYPETNLFTLWADVIIEKPIDAIEHGLFESDEYVLQKIENAEILALAQQRRIKKAFKRGRDAIFEGHLTRVVNSPTDVSQLGSYCYKDHQYPVALIWQAIDGRIICSLRSNTVNVRKIAEKYGGGGHDAAAGFSIPVDKIGILF